MGLVTGGASGLGRATAARFVQQGGKAVICDLPTSEGAKVAEELGSNAIFCPVDVRVIFFYYLEPLCFNCIWIL